MGTISVEQRLKRLSETAVGPSALRGHPAGTIAVVRQYLRESVDLEKFRKATPESFADLLNKHTQDLMEKIRERVGMDACYWGSARKSLNLFLEQASWHYVLRPHFELDRIEALFEVPLDSQVADGLSQANADEGAGQTLEYRKALRAGARLADFNLPAPLPKWTTIKDLLPKVSQAYQAYALEYARKLGCLRVELDLLFWRAEPSSDGKDER